MFDKIYTQRTPSSISIREERHEHRAPTDESVRLLSEMEKAARDKLISITTLTSNEFSATWHLFEDYSCAELEAVCRFKLNGKEHKLKIPIGRDLRFHPHEVAAKIHQAVTSELAKLLTVELFQSQSEIRALAR